VTGLARYGAFLRVPHVAAMLGWSIAARLPVGMCGLGLILLVRGAGGSYAEAGAITAAYAAAVAIGAPYAGRRVDRRGARRVLLPRAFLYPACLGGTAFLAVAGAPPLVLVPVAAAAGLALPPVAASLRTLWSTLLPGDMSQTAFALEAAFQELIFVIGPLAVAALAAVTPSLGIVGAAVVALVGTLAFARLAPVRATIGSEGHEAHRLGALAVPGIRTIVVLSACMGTAFGGAEIAIAAFAEEHGNRSLAGVAFATFAGGSLVGGLVTGLRPTRDRVRRLLVSAALLALLLALPLLAGSVAALAALMFLAGIPIAPLIASAYGVIAAIAAEGAFAESFAWLSTAVTTGVAVGTVAGGWLVDADGSRASFLLGVGAASAAFLAGLAFRRTLYGPRAGAAAARAKAA
jgi:MFS family permease